MSELMWLVIVIHAFFLVLVLRLFCCYYDNPRRWWDVLRPRPNQFQQAVRELVMFLFSNLGKSYHSVNNDDKSTIKGPCLIVCKLMNQYCCININANNIIITKLTLSVNYRVTFKTILFASSLVGAVIWMSYRASITSNLSVREHRLPFSTLSELAANDDYRYACQCVSLILHIDKSSLLELRHICQLQV